MYAASTKPGSDHGLDHDKKNKKIKNKSENQCYSWICFGLLRILFVVNPFSSGHPRLIQMHMPFTVDPHQTICDSLYNYHLGTE